MIHIHHTRLENELIELGNQDAYYLGPDLTLVNCTVVLRLSARAFTLTTTHFIDCQIQAKKRLENFYWCNAFLKNCRFSGIFSGCDFGHWPENFEPEGGLEEGDFSQATLDGCRFIDCDSNTITFPVWPCFTILDPVQRIAEMNTVQWPGNMSILLQTFADYPQRTTAVTFSAPVLAKKLGFHESELKPVLEQLGGIRL